MNAEKQILIDELVTKLNSSPFLLVIGYAGLTVDQFTELRQRLGKNGAACHVAKNSFVRKAALSAEYPEGIAEALVGQTAIITGESDVVAAAKVIKTFRAEFNKPTPRAAVLRGQLLDAASVEALADLPSREELLAKLLGLLNQPATMLVRILNEPAASLARVLQAKADQG
ncbi:50S ribosomal protein L10 [soil metagenome]